MPVLVIAPALGIFSEESLRTSDSLMRLLALLRAPGRTAEPQNRLCLLLPSCRAAKAELIAAHLPRRHTPRLTLSFPLTHPWPSNRFRICRAL